jgi:hypothetical protein
MLRARAFLASGAIAVAVCLPARLAMAQEAERSTPAAGPVAPDRSTAAAGVVNTNHVDTVVVAESGSQVTVNGNGKGADRYAPDPARKAAIIASPIFFGVAGAVFGIAYLSQHATQTCTYNGNGGASCTQNNGTPSLVAYDLTVAIVPSVPRWAVGDVNGALIFTGLRGASVLVASVVSWGNDGSSWMGPFTLGFLAPVTLAIVDLATTPHREDLRAPREAAVAPRFRVTSIAPTALTDPAHHLRGAALGLSATF